MACGEGEQTQSAGRRIKIRLVEIERWWGGNAVGSQEEEEAKLDTEGSISEDGPTSGPRSTPKNFRADVPVRLRVCDVYARAHAQ